MRKEKKPKHKRNKNDTVGGCVSTCDADFVNLTFGSGWLYTLTNIKNICTKVHPCLL